MAYATLTIAERNRLGALNRKNGYGITTQTLIRLTKQHRAARKLGNQHTMEMVEYRLTDINFHSEVAKLVRGEYDILLKELSVS